MPLLLLNDPSPFVPGFLNKEDSSNVHAGSHQTGVDRREAIVQSQINNTAVNRTVVTRSLKQVPV